MSTPTQTIRAAEFTGRTTKQSLAPWRTPIRLARAFAAWWNDDPMSARFHNERERDQQMARRHGA
jgi:hypothetical protein